MEQQQHQWTNDEMVGALHRNEFIPFFQPKIDLATGICSCVEILARWDHPQWGILPPSQFISAIEHAGLIDQFADKLFRQALLCARPYKPGWRGHGHELFRDHPATSWHFEPYLFDGA